jgi:predicted CoA-binding protein
MKNIIQAFVDQKKIAIAGASNNKDNFGTSLLNELAKKDYELYPVNPGCKEIEGRICVPSVKELPAEVENLILAVPPQLTDKIIDQCLGTPIKRVWMIKGVGKGAYSEKAHKVCQDNGIEVVYGFCPMMFFGDGMHKFHFWLRKTLGKLPEEFRLSVN